MSRELASSPAQLVMAGFAGCDPQPPPVLCDLIDRGLAGVVLFARNAGTPAEVRAMVDGLQRRAALAGWPPLLVSIDHEGGRVQRLSDGFTELPPAMALGAAGDPALAYELARATADELRAAGINMNLAPCADVNSNPRNPVIGTRSFGQDPVAVGRLVAATVRGYQDGGVLAVVKHFPGHGDTHQDSHLTLPIINRPPSELERVDLAPFRLAIDAGAAAVMSAHIVVPWLTGDAPATLSRAALRGLLRGRMGFGGMVLTDCLEMRAITDSYSPAEATVRALEAGADLALWSHTADWQLGAVSSIEEALRSGELDPAETASAIARVRSVREALATGGLYCSPSALPPATPAAAVAAEVCRRAVALVGDNAGLLPLGPSTQVWVAGGRGDTARRLSDALTRLGVNARAVEDGESASHRLPRVRDRHGAVLLCLTDSACLDPDQAQGIRIRELLADWGRDKAALIATGLPYDVAGLGCAGASLATFGSGEGAMQALAEVLVGRRKPGGRLPVAL